ncbi:LysR family transcriptional regulator [Herbaspirillum lusitanum]|uniref:LysR family transcriptional regulator n=1 Tax=Herbaspirillum lusitanum TaxID=213312 RepID=UPI000493EB8D|nr:LysR family transcriptional regulator [Herbaspirillum lusitanum]MCW5301046.1 LysR family transcriptional regulator [Herbaspirillum lusitanum]
MRRKIPSITALMAFEAAARYQSFSRAADALSLTEGAISRQIAGLEEFLDLLLFHRVKKRVQLTDIGKAYFAHVREDLNRLERNTLSAMAYQDGQQILELAVIPTFATKWLIPRLSEFSRLHPEIVVNLSERALPFLFGDSVFDAAVHYEHPAWAGNAQELLFEEELVPVCSPQLLGGKTALSIDELAAYPLLQKNTREDVWRHWFDMQGFQGRNPVGGPRHDLFSMIIQAACYGRGIALVPRLYVEDELRSGALLIPLDRPIRGLKKYCVVYPEHEEASPTLKLFIAWLMQAAREQSHGPAMRAGIN